MSQSLTKRQSPKELELESKRSELSTLSESLADAELQFEEMNLSLATFQPRYFQEVGRKYIELDEVRAEIVEALAKKKPNDTEAKEKAKQAREQAEAGSKNMNPL